tara:strand:- start:236 stop:607 length:372 start_codon:yes stop_codon:yes gene_type:complete
MGDFQRGQHCACDFFGINIIYYLRVFGGTKRGLFPFSVRLNKGLSLWRSPIGFATVRVKIAIKADNILIVSPGNMAAETIITQKKRTLFNEIENLIKGGLPLKVITPRNGRILSSPYLDNGEI